MTNRREPKSDNMDIRYTVRMDSDDADKIDSYCRETGKSKSDVLREAVKKHIESENRKRAVIERFNKSNRNGE